MGFTSLPQPFFRHLLLFFPSITFEGCSVRNSLLRLNKESSCLRLPCYRPHIPRRDHDVRLLGHLDLTEEYDADLSKASPDFLTTDLEGIRDLAMHPVTLSHVSRLWICDEVNEHDWSFIVDAIPGLRALEFDDGIHPPPIPSLKILAIGSDMPLRRLPPNLTRLVLGDDFNRPIDSTFLPSTLESIQFGADFNHPIAPGTFRGCKLHSLTFGFDFNQPLSGVLPSSLRFLMLGMSFDRRVRFPSIWCRALVEFVVLLCTFVMFDFAIPHSAQILPGDLPRGLRCLRLRGDFNHTLSGCLPPTLTTLALSFSFDMEIVKEDLPESLCDLLLGHSFNRPLPPLPAGLKRLVLGTCFNCVSLKGRHWVWICYAFAAHSTFAASIRVAVMW